MAVLRALGWHSPPDEAFLDHHERRLTYLEAQARALCEWARVVARKGVGPGH